MSYTNDTKRRPLAAVLGPPFAVGLLVACAFVGLYTAAVHSPRPNGLHLAVVAPASMQALLERGLEDRMPGGFELVSYASEPRARHALLDEDVSGVVVATGREPRLLVASAAGVPAAEAVRAAFGAALGPRLVTEDVRPLPPHDGRGLSAFFLAAGTTVASVLFGALLFLFARDLHTRARLAALVAFAALAGLLVALTTDVVVGALTGAFFAVAVI